MYKRALSLFICIIMLVSSFIGTGVVSSANDEIADEILSQAQTEPIEESSNPVPEIPTATADKNSSVVVPDTATATYSGTCGTNLTWNLDTSTGVLTINGTGDMYDYEYDSTYYTTAPWTYYTSYIKSVVIGDSVTSIGDYAFYDCDSLTSVTIGDPVTSIGSYAFYYCSKLASVTIGDSVTSIGGYAFYYCTSLTGVVVDENNDYYSNDEYGVLYNKDKTELIQYPIGNTRTSYIIPDSVTSIGDYAFYYCYKLTSVTIGDSVTSIGDYAFRSCAALTSVTIPDSVTSIGYYAFNSCTSLTSVYITDIASWCGISFDGYSSNPLNYAKKKNLYLNGTLVTDLVIPDSVTSIGDYAFCDCTSLTSVTIPDPVTSIGDCAFYNCTSLASVTIGDSVTSIGGDAFYNCTSLTSVTIGDSVTSIGDYAFHSCTSLTSVTIPDSVTSIGDRTFYHCDSLTSVTIGDSVTSIGDYAFYYCTSLTSVTIPDSVTSIGDDAFNSCTSLTSVTIGDSVTSIGDDAFNSCYSLTSVTIGDSVTSIGDYAFYYCHKLTSVTIGDSVTSIGDNAFYDCSKLTSVTIGDSVTSIGDYAFYDCDSLTSVTIGGSVTSIGFCAFKDCTSLTSVTIPDSVTSIGYYAFHYYSNSSYYKLNVTLKCIEGSYAHTYAVNNGFKYELYCDHMFENNYIYYPPTCTEDAYEIAGCDHACGEFDIIVYEGTALGHSFTSYTVDSFSCTEGGTKTAYCDNGCGLTDVITLEPTAEEHTWSDWITTVEPTYTSEGEQLRFCLVCNYSEVESIPMLYTPDKPVISVDNFKVTITNAELIKDMRYALGEYTTTTEIKNAEGNVAISESLVIKYTVDGDFIYEMPTAGYFTLWIRMKDGTNYILPLDVTKVTPSVTTYGVRITLHNLFNVKDFYIAKGEYQTYREIKDNGYIVSVTGIKIGNKHDYTYTVYEPGVHTILVRYNDGTTALFHEVLEVDEPVFTTNGLQVTISNLPDVKVIRTAYGEWNTVKELKATNTLRNFSSKSAIKGKDPYTIQYREDGMVTVIIEYNNGYQKVFHYNVQHKQSRCTQTGTTVILRDLEGFVNIRYAMGTYSTSAEIKRAVGSKVIKPSDVTGEYAIVSGLAKGTYTFCVQFDDESYNYFTVTVN